MKLQEVFNTKLELSWEHSVNEFYSEFSIEDRKYGISAIEESLDEINTIRIDFHYKNGNAIQHDATNFGEDALKVLAIVSNGIKSKFADYDIIYFLAKKTSNDKEFSSRVKLYSRIVDKLKVENNRVSVKKELGDEYLFGICKTEDDKKKLIDFIE